MTTCRHESCLALILLAPFFDFGHELVEQQAGELCRQRLMKRKVRKTLAGEGFGHAVEIGAIAGHGRRANRSLDPAYPLKYGSS